MAAAVANASLRSPSASLASPRLFEGNQSSVKAGACGKSCAEVRVVRGQGFGWREAAGSKGSLLRRPTWRMEVANDPLENFRDSFGNECAVERRVRKKLEMTDAYLGLAAELKATRERMAAFVAAEMYKEACMVRDELATLELRKRVLEISARPQIVYRVGDIVTHRRYGYRGVIYGHDPECSAPLEWQEAMKIDLLPRGPNQPFYHILVDARDRPGGMSTYVAQENLALVQEAKPILHPWLHKFFVGFQDDTYVPGPKLRQVYPNDW